MIQWELCADDRLVVVGLSAGALIVYKIKYRRNLGTFQKGSGKMEEEWIKMALDDANTEQKMMWSGSQQGTRLYPGTGAVNSSIVHPE